MYFFKHKGIFRLSNGESIEDFTLAYQCFGKLNTKKDNVIWVCHALTANSNPLEWWNGLVGNNQAIDPNKYFIICVNMLGSCYGSTNAKSTNPKTGSPYLLDFPLISIKDFSDVLEMLRISLKIPSIHLLIGASMGGMHAMQWAIQLKGKVKKLVLLATSAKHTPWGIAFNQAQRLAIQADVTFGENSKNAGRNGLIAARATAMLSYRTAQIYNNRQADDFLDISCKPKAVTYQSYQGEKLANRFDAYAYFNLSKSMDSHHVGRGWKSIPQALGEIKAETLVISISSDLLFPPNEQKYLVKHIQNAKLFQVDSIYGHDAFLVETKKFTSTIEALLKT